MTLSRDQSLVLRGADVDALPLASLIGFDHSSPRGGRVEVVDDAADGPTTDELISQAYQSGFDEGVSAAEAAVRTTIQSVLTALELAAQDFSAAKTAWAATGPEQTLGVALELAELVIMREVATANDPARDAIIRCLSEVASNEPAVLRLNPTDLEGLGPFDDLLIDRTFELVGDPSVASGDVVADTAAGSVDGRLFAALERIRQELLP